MIGEEEWMALAFYATAGEIIFLAGLGLLFVAKAIMEIMKK